MTKAAFFALMGTFAVDLSAARGRQPPGTITILFRRVPILCVPRMWRKVKIDLHTQVYLRASANSGVAVYGPMRSGFAALFLGEKKRIMGELPSEIADMVLLKLAQGSSLRAYLVDASPPNLRKDLPEMGFYISIRCRS
ncbi:MAG: hypothetical protein A3D16_20030 [Rhodobacterales bacterium RIFCSPHIGHO2_02_FULL_62_130]|nr:MAG: hypothetical protein A3D16_20030 [Rhodobacterales bacterium RIFCSPHIGHO2_02_FULL_62_130]OHC60243.1 MAG: hypothetical protein A3E48_17100 [Rhodobacterales bacterium RIFCSPHIGHO2_12_FULL_62_75]HCY99385.1 hypothetical protein [Rhodobacter sp.]